MSYEWTEKAVGSGWHKIVIPLIAMCKEFNIAILQIKEKYGGLRFYAGPMEILDDNGDKNWGRVSAAIDEAECLSMKTCERCGADGRLYYGAWWKTLCPRHAEELGYTENGEDICCPPL